MEKDNFKSGKKVRSDFDILEEEKSYQDHMEELESTEAEATPEQLEKFNKLVDFLDRDVLIKKDLVELAPEEAESAEEYSDRLFGGFKDIEFNLDKMMSDFFKSEIIEKRLKEIRKDIIEGSGNKRNLAGVYESDFAGMSPEFNDGVREKAVGYLLFTNAHAMDEKAKTINEILHLMHSAVVNNEDLLQSLPVIESDGDNVKIYGTNETRGPVAEEIFNGLKGDTSPIDIVSLKDRILMMVRDRGHALTMDIQRDADGKYYVEYFVPKICNVDKVNLLPGVRKVQKKDGVDQSVEFTTGVFSIDSEAEVGKRVLDFIANVPTDKDIIRQ